MFLLQLLAAIFIFVIFVSGKRSHENEIEISGVYIMDKVEGDMKGFHIEYLKSLHQQMTYMNHVTTGTVL